MSGPLPAAHENAVTPSGLHTDQPRRIPIMSGCGKPKNLKAEATFFSMVTMIPLLAPT